MKFKHYAIRIEYAIYLYINIYPTSQSHKCMYTSVRFLWIIVIGKSLEVGSCGKLAKSIIDSDNGFVRSDQNYYLNQKLGNNYMDVAPWQHQAKWSKTKRMYRFTRGLTKAYDVIIQRYLDSHLNI